MPRSPETYTDYRQQQAEISRARSEKGRDIGPLPKVAKPKRKSRCRLSLRFFCETYLCERFPLAWSGDHLKAIARMQTAVLEGGRFALAMPRGSGKTTLAEAAAIWAILCGHRSFVVLIGATEAAAEEMLESIKIELESNDLLLEDFPEVCHAIRRLEGISNRCNGQTLDGKRTRIEWTQKEIVLPTVQKSKASGTVLRVAGITGRIRGMKATKPSGKILRPDFVIPDDTSTDESAKSDEQNNYRERVLRGAILGLAGPKKKIAAVFPCTVIRQNDLADRILDKRKNPEWDSERCKLVYEFPTNAELWEDYKRLRKDGQKQEATDLYRQNREAMDAGAEVAWPERYNEDELSAVQFAMNLLIDDPGSFWAEYQNQPIKETHELSDRLTAQQVLEKFNGLSRGTIPRGCTRTAAFVDVGVEILYYMVCAFDESFGCSVIEYGTFPQQPNQEFKAAKPDIPLSQIFPGDNAQGVILKGLESLLGYLGNRRFVQEETGSEFSVDSGLVDRGYETLTVQKAVRGSPHSKIFRTSKGEGTNTKVTPIPERKKKDEEVKGYYWIRKAASEGGWVVFDANAWKSFVAARIRVHKNERGSLLIYGSEADIAAGIHAQLASHLTSEKSQLIENKSTGRTKNEWIVADIGMENHFFDCLVGCCVAASVHGLIWTPDATPVKKPDRQKIDLEAKAKRGMEMPIL